MTNIDFAALPDAEAARLMAEMDGWRVVKSKSGLWSIHGPKFQVHGYTDEDYAWWTVLQRTNYPYSLDAAVGWLGRMGLIWQRKAERHDKYWVDVFWDAGGVHCEESDTCPTERALCNAGWQAVQAREAANG